MSEVSASNNAVQVMLAKQAIRDVLSRYCRGLDRMDKAMAYSVFHPRAKALYHDIYTGTGHGFVDWVWEAHGAMERHSHQITNVLIEVDGDRAVSEAYVTVALWTLADDSGKQLEIVGRGRYLDRWSRTSTESGEDCWVIEYREHILDMQTLIDLQPGAVNSQSARDDSDASFQFFKKG